MEELKSKEFTQTIYKDNCRGMCAEEFCSKKYKRYVRVKINGLWLYIAFCNEHADIWEKEIECTEI